MKKTIFIIMLVSICSFLNAFIPIPIDEYYEEVALLKGEELKSALHDLIKGHVMYPYFSDSTVATKDIMIEADADLENPGNIILFYSGRSQNAEFRDHGDEFNYMIEYGISHDDSWNREHVWAKSHGFPNMADTAYTDVHHLRPADRSVNGARGNRDFDWGGYSFDEVDGCFFDFDSWEPPDRVKGDVARMLFYMVVRYEGDNDTYDLELLDKTGTYGPRFGKLSTLLLWHELDPVSEQERHRNDVIYSYQHNRNPFIDHPEFVTEIWGKPELDPTVNISELELRFGNQKTGIQSYPIKLVVSGYNLEDDVMVSVEAPFFFSTKKDNSKITQCHFTPENGFLNEELLIYFEPSDKIDYEDALLVYTNSSKENSIILKGHGIDPGAEIILNSSFEDGTDGWTTYSISGNEDWYHSSYGERYFMKMGGFKADEPCVDWLISPTLNLHDFHDIILSFETAKNYSDVTPGLEIFISKDYIIGKNSLDYTWYPLEALLSEGHYEWKHSGYIDISEFATSDVHIGFKYTNSSPSKATSWEVDDVEVIGVKKHEK